MRLPIRLYTDPILSKVCEPVADFSDLSLEPLVQDMIETMIANNGVGLAAPQVGVNKQIAIMHVENRTKIIVLVNPVLLKYAKEKDTLAEGCLSCPGVTLNLKRFRGVEVKAFTALGGEVKYTFLNYDARIFQHEWDHLNGRTIASSLKQYANVL